MAPNVQASRRQGRLSDSQREGDKLVQRLFKFYTPSIPALNKFESLLYNEPFISPR